MSLTPEALAQAEALLKWGRSLEPKGGTNGDRKPLVRVGAPLEGGRSPDAPEPRRSRRADGAASSNGRGAQAHTAGLDRGKPLGSHRRSERELTCFFAFDGNCVGEVEAAGGRVLGHDHEPDEGYCAYHRAANTERARWSDLRLQRAPAT